RAKISQAADCGHRDLAARPELVRARRVRGEPRTRPLQPNLASGLSRERVEGRLALALRRLVSRHMGLRLVLVRFRFLFFLISFFFFFFLFCPRARGFLLFFSFPPPF